VIDKVPFFQDVENLLFPKDLTTAFLGGVYKVFNGGNRRKSNVSDDLFIKFYKIKKFKFDNIKNIRNRRIAHEHGNPPVADIFYI